MMNNYSIYNYSTECLFAKKIADIVNDCGSPKSHLEKIKELFTSELDMVAFFTDCISYWGAEGMRYDQRNQYAVLTSRKIVEHFTDVHIGRNYLTENYGKEAFGFCCCEHRYLQNEFFKTIYEFWKEKENDIYKWLEEMEFVYNEDGTDLIPYAEYRKVKYGY